MESFLPVLNAVDSFLWGAPLIVLLVGTGIMLTLRLSLIQVRRLPRALALILKAKNRGEGDVSSFKALCVALAATIGTGNIVGVATAVKVGGPGAIFWMWMAAFFGMATKYAEGLLAVKYRTTDERGEIAGGPMYYIRHGMGEKYRPLAGFFACAAVLVAFFGIGTFPQVNAIVDSAELSFGVPASRDGYRPHGADRGDHHRRPSEHRRGRRAHHSLYGGSLRGDQRRHHRDAHRRNPRGDRPDPRRGIHRHGGSRRLCGLHDHDGDAERHCTRRLLQ